LSCYTCKRENMILLEWVAQDSILRDHSSQHIFLTPIYHTVSVPLKGDTVFSPLNEIVENLPSAKRNEWERLWMMSVERFFLIFS